MAINKDEASEIYKDLKQIYGDDVEIKSQGKGNNLPYCITKIMVNSKKELNKEDLNILALGPANVSVKRSGNGLTVTYF